MNTDFSLDDMRLFCTLARSGSYRQAATVLNIPVSTLSRRISALEDTLQVRLLHRNAHRLTLTDSGREYAERCSALVDELSATGQELHTRQHSAQGNIRISAPVDLSWVHLADMLAEFSLLYPHISIDLMVSNQNIDLADHSIDLAVRVGEQQASDWIQRPLTEICFRFYTSPQQHQWQRLDSLEQLNEWPLILATPARQWPLINLSTQQRCIYHPGSNVRLRVDNMTIATRAVARGVGVSLLADTTSRSLLSLGQLVAVKTPWQGESRPVTMLYRDRHNQPYRLRLLIDFLLGRFRQNAG